MRGILAGVFVLAACASSAAPVKSSTTASRAEPSDSSLFPASWPSLRDVEAATDPARVDQLARDARSQLDEEYGLSVKDAAHEQAYKRLSVRVRIVHENGLIMTGRSIDALADFAKEPFTCPQSPQHTRDACDSLMAALATAFPNVIPGPGRIAQVDQALVVSDGTSESELSAFLEKAAAFKGSVIQRMRPTSAGGGVLKIGTSLQVRTASKQKLGGGDVVWVAFEPRNIKHVGKTWDLANAHVLFVESTEKP